MAFLAPLAGPIAGAVVGGLMSKSGSKNQTTTTTATNAPWVGAQPALASLYAGAQDAMNRPPEYYPNQTVAPQSNYTQWGNQALVNRVNAGSPQLETAKALAQNTANGHFLYKDPSFNGYANLSNFNANAMNGMSALGQYGYGAFNNTTPGLLGLNSIGGGAMRGQTAGMGGLSGFGAGMGVGNTMGTNQLAQIGSGAMLNSNPYVDDMFNSAAEGVGRNFSKNVLPGVASMFSGAGRYGSNQMAEGVGQATDSYMNSLNRLASDIYGGNYANERGLQQQALGQLQSTGIAERGQQLGALGQMGQLSQNEVAQMLQGLQGAGQIGTAERNQQLAALQNLTGNQLQGAGIQMAALQGLSDQWQNERGLMNQAIQMAPALNQADFYGINQLQNMGLQQDAYNQRVLDADIARWDFNQNRERDNLSFLNNITTGAAPYASSNRTSIAPGNPMSTMNGAFGGMMMGTAMGNMYNNYNAAQQQVPTFNASMMGNPNIMNNPGLDLGMFQG